LLAVFLSKTGFFPKPLLLVIFLGGGHFFWLGVVDVLVVLVLFITFFHHTFMLMMLVVLKFGFVCVISKVVSEATEPNESGFGIQCNYKELRYHNLCSCDS
jgi:membrane protein implicated in regulation of membrane protease activity